MRGVRAKWRWEDVMLLACMVDSIVPASLLCFQMRISSGRPMSLNCIKYKRLQKRNSYSKPSLLSGRLSWRPQAFSLMKSENYLNSEWNKTINRATWGPGTIV